jgi:hypothetical protein
VYVILIRYKQSVQFSSALEQWIGICMKFEVFTAANIVIAFFWVATPYNLVDTYKRFRRTSLHLLIGGVNRSQSLIIQHQ